MERGSGWSQPIKVPKAVLARGHQASLAQIGQMPRSRRLRNVEDRH